MSVGLAQSTKQILLTAFACRAAYFRHHVDAGYRLQRAACRNFKSSLQSCNNNNNNVFRSRSL